jgi:chondroitin AC lyase
MEKVDQAHKDEYESAINSDELVGDRHFYRSDFQVHRTKDFYFSVKMSSKRVVGTESVNEENLKGYHLGDGTSLLYQNGTEYQEVLPFLDWRKLPGTTLSQDTAPLPVIKAWDFKTNSTFVGGVDDTKNGVAVMAYDRDGVKAHKAWFMFGNYVVCLGSDINANTGFPVATGINQVLLKGKLEISKDGNVGGTKDQNQSVEPNWILHDGLGYLFPDGGNLKLESRIIEGSWANISTLYRPIILTEQVLKMWFDHGANPKDKSYAYVLVPNTTSEKMKALNANQPFAISNEKAQQSVMMKDGSLGGIVFYQAGFSNLFGGISVSEPVVLMVTKTADGLAVSVSDPSQKLKNVKLSFGGKYEADNTITEGSKTVVNIAFPQGQDAGKTVVIQLKSK